MPGYNNESRVHRPPPAVTTARRLLASAAAALALAGCQTMETYMPAFRSFGVYKIDINQGNYITQDMVDRLKVGQTRQQVRLVLGTPLVVSAFRDNRWEYIYQFSRQGRIVEHRQFAVFFLDDKLARWEGDEMPQSVVELNRAAGEKALKKLPDADSQGFFGKILDWFKK
jgi:outer membrane protein assembly factor BamE